MNNLSKQCYVVTCVSDTRHVYDLDYHPHHPPKIFIYSNCQNNPNIAGLTIGL